MFTVLGDEARPVGQGPCLRPGAINVYNHPTFSTPCVGFRIKPLYLEGKHFFSRPLSAALAGELFLR